MNANNNPPQAVFTPVTRHAIFIVATLSPVPAHLAAVRAWCGDIAAVVRSVGKRAPAGNLTCVCGFGSEAWDTLFGAPRLASCIRSARSAAGNASPSPRPATSCCISAPMKWICVSNWPRSWSASSATP